MEINPLKYFTLKRSLNVIKILLSFAISKMFKKPVVWGMPLSYSVEPTNHCNLKCPECPSGTGELTRPLGLLEPEQFKKIVDEVKKTGFYFQLFFQGEPFINKKLPELVRYAQANNIYVSISTYGHLINDENIDTVLNDAPDKLIYSVDGMDEKTYQNYRIGGTFNRVDKSLRSLIRRRKELGLRKPFVELQLIVMKQNEHLIRDIKKYGKDVGVDKVVFKTMQVSSLENAKTFLPENKKYSRYIVKNGSFQIKREVRNHCFALWRTSVITWDGKVVPCCFDKDAFYQLGIINGTAFSDVWRSDPYNEFRGRVLKSRSSVDMCTNCTQGMKVNIFDFEQ